MTNYPQADDPLIEKVWQVMQFHTGKMHRLQRSELTKRIYGKVTKSYDRKIRDALSELPVIWDDGYFVPINEREAEGYISAMRSRQAAIGQRLRILDEYLRCNQEPVRVEQMQLLEVG